MDVLNKKLLPNPATIGMRVFQRTLTHSEAGRAWTRGVKGDLMEVFQVVNGKQRLRASDFFTYSKSKTQGNSRKRGQHSEKRTLFTCRMRVLLVVSMMWWHNRQSSCCQLQDHRVAVIHNQENLLKLQSSCLHLWPECRFCKCAIIYECALNNSNSSESLAQPGGAGSAEGKRTGTVYPRCKPPGSTGRLQPQEVTQCENGGVHLQLTLL